MKGSHRVCRHPKPVEIHAGSLNRFCSVRILASLSLICVCLLGGAFSVQAKDKPRDAKADCLKYIQKYRLDQKEIQKFEAEASQLMKKANPKARQRHDLQKQIWDLKDEKSRLYPGTRNSQRKAEINSKISQLEKRFAALDREVKELYRQADFYSDAIRNSKNRFSQLKAMCQKWPGPKKLLGTVTRKGDKEKIYVGGGKKKKKEKGKNAGGKINGCDYLKPSQAPIMPEAQKIGTAGLPKSFPLPPLTDKTVPWTFSLPGGNIYDIGVTTSLGETAAFLRKELPARGWKIDKKAKPSPQAKKSSVYIFFYNADYCGWVTISGKGAPAATGMYVGIKKRGEAARDKSMHMPERSK